MKQETVDFAQKGTLAVVGTGASWSLHEVSALVAIIVGGATFVFVMVQLAFLIRKWYHLEKTTWKSHDTDRGDL